MRSKTVAEKYPNKICLIGCSGILGRAFAKRFMSLTSVVVGDLRTDEYLDFLSDNNISNPKSDPEFYNFINLLDESSSKNFFEWLRIYHPDVDCIVLASALTGRQLRSVSGAFSTFEDYPLEIWKQTIDVNLTGAFLVAKHALTNFRKTGTEGNLIFVGSIYGDHSPHHPSYKTEAFSSTAAYSASKAGVVGLTKWLAGSYAETKMRVNCLVPGGVSEEDVHDTFSEKYSMRTPMGRMARSDEIADALAFLVSKSSRYVNGHVLVVDGGYTCW